MYSRNIAGRSDHAAFTSTYNHRFIMQIRVIAFFNAGVEGITIDMGDAELHQFGMLSDAR